MFQGCCMTGDLVVSDQDGNTIWRFAFPPTVPPQSMSDEDLENWESQRLELVRKNLRSKPHDQLLRYFEEVAVQIVLACADVGATEWLESQHLGDVVGKHLMRRVQPRESNTCSGI